METASRIFGQMSTAARPITSEQVVLGAWPRAVGKKIAQNTRAAKLVRTRLVVEVEDAVWQKNLFGLSLHILKNVQRSVGPGLVDDIEFRVVPKRRQPHRASAAVPLLQDEADQIADPVLRDIYRASRRKALA